MRIPPRTDGNEVRLLNLIGIALFRRVLIALKDGNIDDIKAEIIAYIAYFRVYFLYFFQIINFTSFKRKNVII
jgi:hypothetical protein